MELTTAEQPGTVAVGQPSTVLNPGADTVTSGGGRTEFREAEGKSIESVLDAELASIKAEAKAKADEAAGKVAEKAVDDDKDVKAKADAKAEEKPADKADKVRSEDGKFTKAEKTDDDQAKQADKSAAEKPASGQEGNDRRQSEGRQHQEPPARFLPEARTKWANVPNEVKAEFHRVSREMETEIEQSKAVRERYEPIRQFDEIARSNGRELKESLAKVAQIEAHISRDPIGAIETILREIGPRKADGSPVSLYEVAQVVVQQGPNAIRQSAPQPQQESPQVQALAHQVNELKTQLQTASVKPTIDAFASSHPDYYDLQPQIAAILKSGVVDQIYGTGLSPEQKLAEAYRMAGGNPSSQSAPEPVPAHSEAKPAPSNNAGTRSIRGAPDDGHDPKVEEENQQLDDFFRKELRKFKG